MGFRKIKYRYIRIRQEALRNLSRVQNTRRHAAFCRAAAVTCREARVFPRNNKVWAHGPMSLKFDGPFL